MSLNEQTAQISCPDKSSSEESDAEHTITGAGISSNSDDMATNSAAPLTPSWALHRKLYNWVLQFAYKPYAPLALFIMSFAEASFFPVPPDVLLVPMALERRKCAWWYSAICTFGSVIGGLSGYLIGYLAWTAISTYVFQTHLISPQDFNTVMGWYDKYGFWVVFLAGGFSPIPYKVFTVTAGVFSMYLPAFILACVVGRGLRFFLLGALVWKFGKPVKQFIDRYFNILTLIFIALVALGFILAKVLS